MPRRTRRSTRREPVRLGAGSAGGSYRALVASTAPKRSKYRNQPVEYDGRRFASKRERDRYHTLKRRQEAGEIADLECQVRYRFEVNGVLVGWYTADYRYAVAETGEVVVEDVKSPATRRVRDYPLRKKLLKALYNIEIVEV